MFLSRTLCRGPNKSLIQISNVIRDKAVSIVIVLIQRETISNHSHFAYSCFAYDLSHFAYSHFANSRFAYSEKLDYSRFAYSSLLIKIFFFFFFFLLMFVIQYNVTTQGIKLSKMPLFYEVKNIWIYIHVTLKWKKNIYTVSLESIYKNVKPTLRIVITPCLCSNLWQF